MSQVEFISSIGIGWDELYYCMHLSGALQLLQFILVVWLVVFLVFSPVLGMVAVSGSDRREVAAVVSCWAVALTEPWIHLSWHFPRQ